MNSPGQHSAPEVLLAVAEAVAGEIGHDFLTKLVWALKTYMRTSLVLITIGEGEPPRRVRAVYALSDDTPVHDLSYDLDGTPCAAVFDGNFVVIPCDLAQNFPREAGKESYIGAPIFSEAGRVEGHLALFSPEPISEAELCSSIVRIFAQRIEAEHRRVAIEDQRQRLIADLADVNDRLRRRYQSVHQANAFKTRLLGMIAHDLRNPLAAIMANSELALTLRPALPAAAETFDTACHKVVNNAERMASMIDATLQRVREESGTLELSRANVDLATLIRVVIQANKEAAGQKSIRLHFDDSNSVLADVDEELLLQTIDNLVGNAIKYGHPGGQANVTLSSTPNAAVICVSDDGQGFTEEDLTRVFKPFQTLSAKPTAGETATGLGLANVKEIVEAHGGTIAVESQGRASGATFTIHLPR